MSNQDNDSDRYGNQAYGQEWRNTGNYRYGEGPFGNWGPGYYGYGNQGYGQGNQGYGQGNQGYGQGNQGYGQGQPSYGYQGAAYTGNYGTYGYPGGMYNPSGSNQYGTRYSQGANYGNAGWGNAGINQQGRASGPFAGVGPQNYQRSDQRIQEDINDRLTEHPNLDARNINVDVHSGDVTLNGWVDSRQDKRIAEDIADSVTGVKNVSNNLSVQPSHQQQPGWMQSIENAFTPGNAPSTSQGQQGQTGQQTAQPGTRR